MILKVCNIAVKMIALHQDVCYKKHLKSFAIMSLLNKYANVLSGCKSTWNAIHLKYKKLA